MQAVATVRRQCVRRPAVAQLHLQQVTGAVAKAGQLATSPRALYSYCQVPPFGSTSFSGNAKTGCQVVNVLLPSGSRTSVRLPCSS